MKFIQILIKPAGLDGAALFALGEDGNVYYFQLGFWHKMTNKVFEEEVGEEE